MRDPTSVCPPGGETIREVYRRVRAFWAAEISPRGDRIVVVAHKVVNALIRAVIENRTDLENLWGWLPGNAEFQVLPLSSTSPPDKPTSISANPRAGRQ